VAGLVAVRTPPIEAINPDRQITLDLAALANDSQAELVQKYPSRFPGFIASLPLNYPEESVRELERAVTTLGALGVQVLSNVNGLPLDDDRFFPLFEAAARLECPILLHPARGAGFADYPGEAKSKYEIWWTFGWPYETSAAMQRLVFSRQFIACRRSPTVQHRRDGSAFEGRVGYGLTSWARPADEDYEGLCKSMSQRYDYFKDVLGGHGRARQPGRHRMRRKFFGEDQVVFASDALPVGRTAAGIRETIRAIDSLEITAGARKRSAWGTPNARSFAFSEAAKL
jgi:aminocarboxymuconate-semialdehyde decarboxylase